MRYLGSLRGTHRYGLILALVVVQFVLLSAAGESIWVRVGGAVLGAATFVLAFLTGGLATRTRHVVVAIALAVIVAVLAAGAVGGDATRGVVGSVSALLVLAVAVTVLRAISRLPVANRQMILGALSIYLMLGLFFAYVYSAVSAFDPRPFFAGGQAETIAHFVYFSYITQTTVGYGDFTGANGLNRTLAVIQALTGQLYLVTIVAIVIGNLGRTRRAAQS